VYVIDVVFINMNLVYCLTFPQNNTQMEFLVTIRDSGKSRQKIAKKTRQTFSKW